MSGRVASLTVILAVVTAVATATGCARPGVPTGGAVPETRLRVIETSPPHLSLVEPFDDPVELRFERTVSERPTEGSPGDAVIVSPQTGAVTVETSDDVVQVSMEGGFVEGTVYRITLLPRFQDRFRNRMTTAHDLIFSTGGALEPTLLAGVTSDRLTLRQLGGTRIDAVPVDEGTVRSTVADSSGVFTFPYLPSGRYRLVAYEDRNGNREPDDSERQVSLDQGVNAGDTIVVTDLPLLLPDATPAEVEGANLLDSLSLRVTFDDPLDSNGSLEGVEAIVTRPGGNAPEVVEILFRWRWNQRTAAAGAVTPTAPIPAAPDPTAVDPTPPDPTDLASSLPSREIVLILSRPLVEGAEYVVEVGGVVNLNNVPGGGGTAELEGPPPG